MKPRTLKDLSPTDLRGYISSLEGLRNNSQEHDRRYSGLTDVFQRIAVLVEPAISEAITEQERRIKEVFPGIEIGDLIEHRFPAGNTPPDRIHGSVTPEGVVTRIGKVSHFGYASDGAVMFYYDEEGKLGVITTKPLYHLWKKLEE